MKTALKIAALVVLALVVVTGLVVTLRAGAVPVLEIRPAVPALVFEQVGDAIVVIV